MSEPKEPLIRLRALLDFDNERQIFVAQCLETGSVCTAEDVQTVQEILIELLDDEIGFNLDHDNLANLFNCPAPSTVWINWMDSHHLQNLALDPKTTRWPFRDLPLPVAVLSLRTSTTLSKEER